MIIKDLQAGWIVLINERDRLSFSTPDGLKAPFRAVVFDDRSGSVIPRDRFWVN